MHTEAKALAFVLSALLLSVGAPHRGVAQESGSPPIFVTIPDAYPDVDGRALLLREPGRDVIVLAGDAQAEDLSVALNMLRRFGRERSRPEAGRGHMIPIVGYAPPPVLSDADRLRLESVLAELRERPLANVGNLGRGRWMRFPDR